jgi:hypothetical protein
MEKPSQKTVVAILEIERPSDCQNKFTEANEGNEEGEMH